MKIYIVIFSLSLLISNNVLAQESPLIRIEGVTGEEKSFEPIIDESGVASIQDIHVYPSNNHQTEESIAINPIDSDNLLIGANVKIPGQTIFK